MAELGNYLLDEVLIKRTAALLATGASKEDVKKELNLSRFQLARIMASPTYKATTKEIGDSSVTEAIQIIRHRTAKLAVKAVEVLDKQLDKNNLEAVKIVFKATGVLDQAEQSQGDTNITVVIPGQKEVKDVESEPITVEQSETYD